MRRTLEIVAVVAVFVVARELVTATHRALWSPAIGWWSGLLFYALWIPLLVIHASLRTRPRVIPPSEMWTRRNVIVLAVAIAVTEWMYGMPITRIATGQLAVHEPAAWQYLVNAMIAAPVIEEWIFRGVLWDELEARSSTWLAFVVTSVLFGPWHWSSFFAPSWYGSGQTFVWVHVMFGALLGAVRWRFRAIGVGLVLHALWNALVPLSG
ncbi:MAG TPA: CPBP family intramembrane glutamic endopeptidase [Kofleriaceae bacterium]|nr:CPBP family intramembrane glutamic endopeptidase [Kofleriaceae bacterium]